MKYRRYYQRVLKDRLTALRKVRHATVCSAGAILENVCDIDIVHTSIQGEARTPEARAVTRFILNSDRFLSSKNVKQSQDF